MEKINLMINGLPGNVAAKIAQFAIADERFNVIAYSLTGQEIENKTYSIDSINFDLVKPDIRDKKIQEIKSGFNCQKCQYSLRSCNNNAWTEVKA